MTRYQDWQRGIRKRRDAKPPTFNPDAGCYPALYKGQCIKFDGELETASVKVWNGSDWVWTDIPIAKKRTRHLAGELLSPSLIARDGRIHLSVPFKIKPDRLADGPVCAVDVGINTTATLAIICPDGTVTARKFIHPAADIDRRTNRLR